MVSFHAYTAEIVESKANDVFFCWRIGWLIPPRLHSVVTRVMAPASPPSTRFNNVSDCEGAGVRLGGWEKGGHQYGQNNSVSF